MRRRIRREKMSDIVAKIHELDLSYEEGAKQFGISVSSIYAYNHRLKKRCAAQGDCTTSSDTSSRQNDQLVEKNNADKKEKRTPNVSSTSGGLPQSIIDLIVQYRKDNPDHGYKRIADHLQKDYLVVVSRKKIREVLKSAGLHSSCDSSFDTIAPEEKEGKGVRRFEAPCARDMYQMDISYIYLSGMSTHYLIDIIDDYSRFCVAAQLCNNQSSEQVLEVLAQAIGRYGKPRCLLTDQGRCFYTWSAHQTRFQEYLDNEGIEHIVSEPHSPQTLGKLERFHQTIKRELFHKKQLSSYAEACEALYEYVDYYNFNRTHQGIDGGVPSERFLNVSQEVSRIESVCSVPAESKDTDNGYLLFKTLGQTLSVVQNSDSLQIFLNGKLLQLRSEGKD